MRDLKPAKYSKQAESEMVSVHIAKGYFLDRHFTPYLSENDKTPNIDGSIDINDSEGYPLGKVEVQLKTLPDKYSKPSFNATLKMLVYARDSQLPFILLVVDQNNKKVFWKEITPELSRERIGTAFDKNPNQETIVIHFDKENELSNNKFYDKWLHIIDTNKSILKNWSKVNSEIEDYRIQVLSLTNELEEIDSEIDSNFIFLNKYLEKLNGLTNNEFLTIKQIFKIDFWRFGVAVFKFKKENLAYGLFPIGWNENKKQILRFKTEPTNFGDYAFRYDFLKAYSGSNPIIESPEKYAFKSVSEFLSLIIKRKILWPVDKNLEEEYLGYIINKDFRTKYQLKQVPLSNLKKSIDHLIELIPREKELSIEFPEKEHNLLRAIDYVQNFQINGIENLEIKSPTHNDLRNVAISVGEKGVFPKDIKSTLYEFWTRAIRSYENVLEQFFPLISNELGFFKDFGQLVVVPVIAKDDHNDRSFAIARILLIELKEHIDSANERVIITEDYMKLKFDIIERTIELDNDTYEFIGYNTISFSQISSELPIRNWVYKHLTEKVKEYFDRKQEE